MTRPQVDWTSVAVPSLVAAATTWFSLIAWAGFVQDPGEYLGPALTAVLLVAVAGTLLRSVRTPALVVLVVQLLLLAVWFTHRWVPEEATFGGWIPTSGSVADAAVLLGEGALAAQAYQAPVPPEGAQIFPLLVLSGSLVAVLVDFLACGLRKAPVAGLPLLAVYTAPVSILDGGVPWWAFALGALGFLTLLLTEQARTLAHWGRAVSRSASAVDAGTGPLPGLSLRSSARRIGLTATSLAVVAPLVIPTLGDSLLPSGGPGGEGDGSSVAISNPMVDLRRDLVRGRDVDLVTLATPDPDPSYLRISVLDTFNGLTWKPSGRDIPAEQIASGELPDPPGLDAEVPRTEVDYRIAIEDAFDTTWLPTPYPVTSIEAPGDWRYDTDTFDFISAVEDQNGAGLEYSLTAFRTDPSAEVLQRGGAAPESVFTPYTELPEDLPDTVSDLAEEVTDGLGSKYEKAVALQSWFRNPDNFEYDLNQGPSGSANEDLVTFLTPGPEGRIGYCEQFAASMALMGRSLGIPSRVAVGFLEPDRIGDNRYVFSAWDLHAWPEMYFDGAGWVRFEPTPGTRAPEVPAYTIGNIDEPEPTEGPSASGPTQAPEQQDPNRLDEGEGGATDPTAGGGTGGTLGRVVLVGLLLGGLVLAPQLLRTVTRRRRWAGATTARESAEAGWDELRDTALDLRFGWDDTVTVRNQARTLAGVFGATGPRRPDEPVRRRSVGASANPEAAHALERVVRDVEQARYSRDLVGRVGRDGDEVRADVERCTEAMYAGALKKRRRTARWLPASLVRGDLLRLRPPVRRTGHVATEPGVDRAL